MISMPRMSIGLMVLCLMVSCKQSPDGLVGSVVPVSGVPETHPKKSTAEDIDSLNGRITELESKIVLLELVADPARPKSALFDDPTEPGYALGRSHFGSFAVSIKDIEPYAGGTKLTIQILNLAGATLSDATIKVNYGDASIEELVADLAANRTVEHVSVEPVEVSSTKKYPGNMWVTESVVLPSLPPEKVKNVSIGFNAEQLFAKVSREDL